LNTPSESATRDQIGAAIAEIAEHRAVIDHAIGMLILLYGMDDETAFDMLRVRSQDTNIKLRTLAKQLVADFRALSNGEALPPRSMYDKMLMTVHERITQDRSPN
jgi:septum formation inhibitor-activating ATPase MinD